MMPVIGNAADLLDAALYFAEGNWGEASSSLACSAPGVGIGVAGGWLLYERVRTTTRIANKSDNVADTAFFASRRYKLAAGRTRAEIRNIRRKLDDDFAKRGGKVQLLRQYEGFDSTGQRICGEFDPVKLKIYLYKGSDFSTLSHELIHFGQVRARGLLGSNKAFGVTKVCEDAVHDHAQFNHGGALFAR